MKNLKTLSILAMFMALVSFSAPLKREIKTVTLKVEGSCGMCK